MEAHDYNRIFLARTTKRQSLLASFFRMAANFPRFRRYAINRICSLEGDQLWSATYRELMRKYYDVKIGFYSYGPCLMPSGLPEGTCIGNYCSFGPGITAWRRNHPTDRFTQHPFFFNSALGLIKQDSVAAVRDCPLVVQDDVWVGANVIIAPGCKTIGIGAIIGAGAVVTKDVPAFAIVGGIPARKIGMRFTPEIQRILLESLWWKHPVEHLVPLLPLFLEDATEKSARKLRDSLQTLSRQE